MTTDTLVMMAGAALSLAFSYVPTLRGWYESKPSDIKRAVMAGAMLGVAILSVVFGCTGVFAQYATDCTASGVEQLVGAFFAALVANQATYMITAQK